MLRKGKTASTGRSSSAARLGGGQRPVSRAAAAAPYTYLDNMVLSDRFFLSRY